MLEKSLLECKKVFSGAPKVSSNCHKHSYNEFSNNIDKGAKCKRSNMIGPCQHHHPRLFFGLN